MSTTKNQLRGNALRARIVETVRKYVAEQNGSIDPDRISMKAIAARVPCSRTTLLKYDDIVTNTLRDIGMRLARRTGEARVEVLLDRVDLLKKENADLKAEIRAVRIHHVQLYERLLMESASLAALVRTIGTTASKLQERCILCGGEPPAVHSDNVVELHKPSDNRR